MADQDKPNVSQWEEIEPGVWKAAKADDQIEGVLIQKRERTGKYDTESYVIENEAGMHLIFSTTVLQQRMQLVNVGDRIRITYKGTEKNVKDQDVKIFKVERAKMTT